MLAKQPGRRYNPVSVEEDLSSFEAFRKIIARLRSPTGCPWDRKQTHESLKPYLIEEAYEVIQALDKGDHQKLCEELGDLLLQIGLHAQIAAEAGEFDISDVIRGINEKLIRRHPHVFGDLEVKRADEVPFLWEELKRKEGKKGSILDSVPREMPALARSQLLQERAARVGFDWERVEGVLDKVAEEVQELKEAESPLQKASEFGDLLFALANYARWIGIDLEAALRSANEKFYRRFTKMEELCRKRGLSMEKLSLEELDALWEEAKKLEET